MSKLINEFVEAEAALTFYQLKRPENGERADFVCIFTSLIGGFGGMLAGYGSSSDSPYLARPLLNNIRHSLCKHLNLDILEKFS
jgi:hypothetical protein